MHEEDTTAPTEQGGRIESCQFWTFAFIYYADVAYQEAFLMFALLSTGLSAFQCVCLCCRLMMLRCVLTMLRGCPTTLCIVFVSLCIVALDMCVCRVVHNMFVCQEICSNSNI